MLTEKLFAEGRYLRMALKAAQTHPKLKKYITQILTYSLEEKLNECLKLHMLTFNFIQHTVCWKTLSSEAVGEWH